MLLLAHLLHFLPYSITGGAGSDHAASSSQQPYGLLASAVGGHHGQLASSVVVATTAAASGSPRSHTGSWSRPSAGSRPSSNPSPSRGSGQHMAGSPGAGQHQQALMGRTTPSRTTTGGIGSRGGSGTMATGSPQQPKFVYGYEQPSTTTQHQQLGDLFIATQLKGPQRYGESVLACGTGKSACCKC